MVSDDSLSLSRKKHTTCKDFNWWDSFITTSPIRCLWAAYICVAATTPGTCMQTLFVSCGAPNEDLEVQDFLSCCSREGWPKEGHQVSVMAQHCGLFPYLTPSAYIIDWGHLLTVGWPYCLDLIIRHCSLYSLQFETVVFQFVIEWSTDMRILYCCYYSL